MDQRRQGALRGWLALALAACTADPSRSVPDTAPVASIGPGPAAAVSAAPAADAAPAGLGPVRSLTVAQLPTDLALSGHVSKAIAWTDANGDNFAVFMARWRHSIDEHDPVQSVTLTAVHAAYQRGVKRVLRTVTDQRESCDDPAMKGAFLDHALDVGDLDGDGIAELTFAYRITCQGHRLPFVQKLLVLENGDKYILRSTGASGFDVDASFENAPAPFLEHAKAQWQRAASAP